MGERSRSEQDLRATSDALQSDAERLAELEDVKRGLDPSDPRVDQLSDEVYNLATEIKDKSEAERELSDQLEQGEGRQPPS